MTRHYFEVAQKDNQGRRTGPVRRFWLNDLSLPSRILAGKRLPSRSAVDTDLTYAEKTRTFKDSLPLIRNLDDYRKNLLQRRYLILAEGSIEIP